ncbi:peptidase C26 [Streptomyces viridosporus ATCC 14672]|uniref:Peptidase C26 n=1 Tax=Streptomyces viridosporus (strain ATCC 14672 / DSM 40746 / JCM 4963 / KCTC 9882 / NRRL B-12104 / FH 1290) TaxID=566461 RepID=D6A961_STRV1|nr:peptidase C26 [Streptomyces viridosporus ATCC 14672]
MDQTVTAPRAEGNDFPGAAPGSDGPRIAVLGSLDYPDLTDEDTAMIRRLARTALATFRGLGARCEFVETSTPLKDLGDPERVTEYDGLFLLGGGDVHPELYGRGKAVPRTFGVDRRADEFALTAIRAAVDAGRPVLGVCRGSQLINVAFGGTLIPDIEDHRLHRGGPGEPLFVDEKVTVTEGTRLAGLVRDTRLTVRSGHHQAVDRVGGELVAVARADDGVVEATEHPDKWVVGIQWHPEDPAGSQTHRLRLFEGFVAACAQDPQPR